MKFKRLFVSIVAGFLIQSGGAYGSGFNNFPAAGAAGSALGGMFYAGQDGLNSAFVNPSMLILIKNTEISLNLTDHYGEFSYSKKNAYQHQSFGENDINISGGVVWPVSENMRFALGYHRVLSLDVSWPFVLLRYRGSSSVIRSFELNHHLHTDAIVPAFAYRINKLSIGVAADVYSANQQLSFPWSSPLWEKYSELDIAYQYKYELSGWAVGGHLGVSYDLDETMRLAFSARNGVTFNLDGQVETQMFKAIAALDTANVHAADATPGKSDVSTTRETPWEFGVGLIYKVNPSITVNLDARYALWGSIRDEESFKFKEAGWGDSLSMTDPYTGFPGAHLRQEMKNKYDLGAGFSYATGEQWIYRLGYTYAGNPNEAGTFNFLQPMVARHGLSVGAGFSGSQYTMDVSVAYYFGISQRVGVKDNPNFAGKYDSSMLAPRLSIRYKL